MDKLGGALEFLRVPHFFRDVLTTCGGLLFLALANQFYYLDLALVRNIEYFSSFVRATLLLIVAFFAGKLIVMLAQLWAIILRFILRLDKAKAFQDAYNDLRSYGNPGSRTINQSDELMLNAEIDGFIEDSPSLRAEIDRRVFYMISLDLFIGLCLAGIGLWNLWPLAAPLFIFSFMAMKDQVSMWEFRAEVAELMRRKQFRK